jgi:hypothetical protein
MTTMTAKLLLALVSTVILGQSPRGHMAIFYCLTALGNFRPSCDYVTIIYVYYSVYSRCYTTTAR